MRHYFTFEQYSGGDTSITKADFNDEVRWLEDSAKFPRGQFIRADRSKDGYYVDIEPYGAIDGFEIRWKIGGYTNRFLVTKSGDIYGLLRFIPGNSAYWVRLDKDKTLASTIGNSYPDGGVYQLEGKESCIPLKSNNFLAKLAGISVNNVNINKKRIWSSKIDRMRMFVEFSGQICEVSS